MPAPRLSRQGLPDEGRSAQQTEIDTCCDDSDSAASHDVADWAGNVTRKNGLRTKLDRKRKTTKMRQGETQAVCNGQEDEATSDEIGVYTQTKEGTGAAEQLKKKKGKNKHNNRKQKNKNKNAKPARSAATEANNGVEENGYGISPPGSRWNYATRQDANYWDTGDGETENLFSLSAINRRLATKDHAGLPNKVEFRTYIENRVEIEGGFATEHIAAGTRILNERPLLLQPPSDEERPIEIRVHDIAEAFDALPPADQKTYMELSPRSALTLAGLSREIDYLIKCYKFLHAKGDWRSEEEEANYNSLGSHLSVLCKKWRIGARFYRTSFDFPVVTGYLPDGSPRRAIGGAVFANISRLNHSCVPNCWTQPNPESGTVTVHATRDIAPGEELRVSALGSRHWRLTAAMRAKELLETGSVVCSCPACDTSNPDFERQDKLRDTLNKQSIYMHGFVQAAQTCDHEGRYRELRNGVWGVAGDQLNLGTYERAESCILEMFHLLQELGCADVEWVDLRRILQKLVYPRLGKWYAIIAQGRKMLADTERCMGKDNEVYMQLREEVEATETRARLKQLEHDEQTKAREERQKEEQARLEDQYRATVDYIINRLPVTTTILFRSYSTG